MAFIQLFLILMLLGTTILVGTTDIEPRPAALMMLVAAPLVSLVAVRFRPMRRIFSYIFFLG